jgi:predicted RNase H-like HicB family nuclease
VRIKPKSANIAAEANHAENHVNLHEYMRLALQGAKYETLDDNGTIYAEIPGFDGVYANASTREECQQELAEVLADWLQLRLQWGRPVPVVGGIDLAGA